jgi:hypothetical protein
VEHIVAGIAKLIYEASGIVKLISKIAGIVRFAFENC